MALDVLYEAEIRGVLPTEALDMRQAEGWVLPTDSSDELDGERADREPTVEVLQYASALIEGVQDHHAEVDELIARYADRWAIERMPVIDRTLLRMAIFELMWRDDIPVAVAINEAVELAKSLSTEDSGRFINGLLGKIVEKESLADS